MSTLFPPAPAHYEPSAAERGPRLRTLLHRHGGGSLGFMATWHGTRAWLSEDTRAALGYRVVGSVAIAVSDPICVPGTEAAVIAEFARWCGRRGLTPALYAVHDRLLPAIRALDWHAVGVGTEAVIEVDGFSLSGRRRQNIRTAVNRARREGLRIEWTSMDRLDDARRTQVREVSAAWSRDRSLPQLGFTLGGLRELEDPEVRLALAVDDAGRVHALTSWLPVHEDDRVVGVTLDLMRRRPDATPGAIDFLIAQVAFLGRAAGWRTVSLSASPLAFSTEAGEASRRVTSQRVAARIGALLEPVYGFRSLAAFKARFASDEPRLWLAVPGRTALPRVTRAVLSAYLPGSGIVSIARILLRARRG
jgi:phosphatidylglycerol lysyltransferase